MHWFTDSQPISQTWSITGSALNDINQYLLHLFCCSWPTNKKTSHNKLDQVGHFHRHVVWGWAWASVKYILNGHQYKIHASMSWHPVLQQICSALLLLPPCHAHTLALTQSPALDLLRSATSNCHLTSLSLLTHLLAPSASNPSSSRASSPLKWLY